MDEEHTYHVRCPPTYVELLRLLQCGYWGVPSQRCLRLDCCSNLFAKLRFFSVDLSCREFLKQGHNRCRLSCFHACIVGIPGVALACGLHVFFCTEFLWYFGVLVRQKAWSCFKTSRDQCVRCFDSCGVGGISTQEVWKSSPICDKENPADTSRYLPKQTTPTTPTSFHER